MDLDYLLAILERKASNYDSTRKDRHQAIIKQILSKYPYTLPFMLMAHG